MKTIHTMGEFGLIQAISHDFIYRPSLVKEGAGDDAAVYRVPPGYDELISTDTMVEGIHFTKETMSAEDVGYHFCASNFSDIAAMGGDPIGFVLSMALPDDLPFSWVSSLYDGMRACCRKYKVNLLGGDVTGSEKGIILTGTVIGMVPEGKAVLRSGAKLGDLIFVTGTIGDSAAGLCAITRHMADRFPYLAKRHRRPEPQVSNAAFLRQIGATSLNDISDGLSREITEICQSSGVNAVIERENIPISEEARTLGKLLHHDPVEWALNGGEDYELVGTIPKEAENKVSNLQDIHIIGTIKEKGNGQVWIKSSTSMELLPVHGFDHFQRR